MLTKVFQSGNSQAVRLPKEMRFDTSEVEIFKRGNEVVLREKTRSLSDAFKLLTQMPDDFMAEARQDDKPQERESF